MRLISLTHPETIAPLSNEIRYGTQVTQFGICVVALRGEYICSLFFVDQADHTSITAYLRTQWQNCDIRHDQLHAQPILTALFSEKPPDNMHLLVSGTPFQRAVWQALLSIPFGSTCSYREIAERIHKPRAVRAVARAIAGNPIAYLIPCHRVILSSGKLHHYRWGAERKKALIAYEESFISLEAAF
jgi:O-6-methylguanine DNA methyltransferase